MKRLVLVVLAFTTAYVLNAQIELPQQSPLAKLEQTVGLTKVTIEYSRPGVKGRTIFGDLLPFGKIWRTGANKNAIITFSDDVTMAGQALKAGAYAIFIKLNSETQWEVFFYMDIENWGVPKEWDDTKVAATVSIEVKQIPISFENFMFNINNLTPSSATLDVIWSNSFVSIPFTVPTDTKVTSTIDKVMAGPSANDYYAAAVYYLEYNKDIKQAKIWMDKAITMIEKPKFWQLRQFALVYAKTGDIKQAIEYAKQSLEAAKEADNSAYINMNIESLKTWGAKGF